MKFTGYLFLALAVYLVLPAGSNGSDYFNKIFCHPKFWDFSKCVKKEGGKDVKEVLEECNKKLIPDDNEKVYYRSLCNDTHNRNMFLRCNYEEIAKHGAFVLPTKCMKIVQMKGSDAGKKVQKYLCENDDRFKCLRKHAPYEDLKVMDICQHKLFPEVTTKEFQVFVCEMKDTFDLKRLADFKTCWGNKLKEAGRPVPPRYAIECKLIEKGSVIKWWLCDKRSRYKCIKNNLPVNMTMEVDQCMHEFFPKVTDTDLSSVCDVDGDEVEEKIGRVTGCAIHHFKKKNPNIARIFITKC